MVVGRRMCSMLPYGTGIRLYALYICLVSISVLYIFSNLVSDRMVDDGSMT